MLPSDRYTGGDLGRLLSQYSHPLHSKDSFLLLDTCICGLGTDLGGRHSPKSQSPNGFPFKMVSSLGQSRTGRMRTRRLA